MEKRKKERKRVRMRTCVAGADAGRGPTCHRTTAGPSLPPFSHLPVVVVVVVVVDVVVEGYCSQEQEFGMQRRDAGRG